MAKTKYPVKDATRDLVLSITENDIKTAKRRDNYACAAAHALCRQQHYKQARVNKTTTMVALADGSWLRFITPGDLYTELMIFDRGGRMAAGQYILKAPKGTLKLGYRPKPTGPKAETGRPRRKQHVIDNVREDAPKGGAAYRALFE